MMMDFTMNPRVLLLIIMNDFKQQYTKNKVMEEVTILSPKSG